MPEYEITFKKRFRLRDDQRPEDVGKMYAETIGFEVVGFELVPKEEKEK